MTAGETSLLMAKARGYVYSPIAYHDSWLSLDPIVGCSLDCQYCFMRQTGWTAVRPDRSLSVSALTEMLLRHPLFRPHLTVLSFGNQTDTFLPGNISYFREFIDHLEARALTNPLVVVTKKHVPEGVIQWATQLRSVRLILCVSYSGLDATVEKGVVSWEAQDNFRRLREAGRPAIHFWRPLTHESGAASVIERVLDVVGSTAEASVYIGLKTSPGMMQVYRENGRLIPSGVEVPAGDYIPPGVEERLRELAGRRYPGYPLYKHTSCAVSLVLGVPDYNATVFRPVCAESACPSWKRAVCERARRRPTAAEVRETLGALRRDIQFEIVDGAVELEGTVSQEEYSFLLHALGVPVRARVARTRNVWGSVFRQSGVSEDEQRHDGAGRLGANKHPSGVA